jgi:hypothetical protein
MAKTNKEINLSQLDKELGVVGLNAASKDGEWEISYADGRPDDQALLNAIESHISQPNPQPTVADKLASVGLSLEELKAALGGN